MCNKGRNISTWFLLVLFIGFISGITLFTHTHIINKELYYHSHPYDKSESSQHTHTQEQLQLLDLYYNTILEPDVVPSFSFVAIFQLESILNDRVPVFFENTNQPSYFRLRAPPSL